MRVRKRIKKPGLSPGALVYVGEKKVEKVSINLIDYDETRFQEKEAKKIEECFPFKDSPSVTWININGLHEVEIIEKLGKHFKLHPLLLEDILHTDQRPKMEDFDEYIFVIIKMLYFLEKENEIFSEQVSIILGPNFVISFQEKEGDVFEPIRERIRNGKGRIRKMGPDYLAYALIDAVVDHYFIILEKLGEKIESMEEDLLNEPTTKTMQNIHELKREMIYLRKSVWPLREVVSTLERGESKLISDPTRIYLRDVYDHTIQVIDSIESYRDILSGLLDLYLSVISNKMNEVMKVLTIIATIFIPLTFIAGIYGMNFNPEASPLNMPELNWVYGYPAVWVVMVLVGIFMFAFFKRKRWL